jgi:predicted dehydrogenase
MLKSKLLFCALAAMLTACRSDIKQTEVRLITVDPGHFHAALVQKTMYPEVSPEVFVYAPEGAELQDHIAKIEAYNHRADNPTRWKENVVATPDFLDRMSKEKKGNVAVISGNNLKKTEYIEAALNASINVLADKPMAINTAQFNRLEQCFASAKSKGLLLYDIMTERFEITSVLQRELSQIPAIYGQQTVGTPEKPGVEMSSVHLFLKTVSGKPLIRPAWFFDVNQQGEAIADVAVHLVDLVQWELFPDQAIDYRSDIEMLNAQHWTTPLSLQQFAEITALPEFPEFLQSHTDNDTLKIYANGSISYKIKGIHAQISVRWDYTNEAGSDTHYSVLRGSQAELVVRQGIDENFKPTLYIIPTANRDLRDFESELAANFKAIQKKYPGIELTKTAKNEWKALIPDSLRSGHESHFAQVTDNFLTFLREGSLPEWEIPSMIAKYYVTTKAQDIAGDICPDLE